MPGPPASMMMIAMTQAKTGRSRKNFDNIRYLRLICFCRRLDCLSGFRTLLPTGTEWNNLYGGAGVHFLNTLDDQLIARCKTRGYEPFVADGTIHRDHPLLDFTLRIYDQRDGIALGVTGDPLLGSKNCMINHPFLDKDAHIHARKKNMFRVRKDHPEDKRSRTGINGDIGKLEVPFQWIGCAVFKEQLHPCLAGTVAFDPTHCYVPFELQVIGA